MSWTAAILGLLVLAVVAGPTAVAAEPPGIAWVQQFGTPEFDSAQTMVADLSGVYVAGRTMGALPGFTHEGWDDVFVRKYDADGNELWTRQFGTPENDEPNDAFADASGVYVAGTVGGALPDQTFLGGFDAFVRKYDAAGNELWTRQFGTAARDNLNTVAADPSGVYLGGGTHGSLPGYTRLGLEDAFVTKVDPDGTELWTLQFGTSETDRASDVALDTTGVYVAGTVDGALPGQTGGGGVDVFIMKLDPDGNEIWTRQFGTSGGDMGIHIAADASGVYASGTTMDAFPGFASAGQGDPFLRKYDPDGNEVWTRQFGTAGHDGSGTVLALSTGVVISGGVQGTLPGQTGLGMTDAFLRMYDATGAEVWTLQFGTSGGEAAFAVSGDESALYAAGLVGADAFPGFVTGGPADAWVAKLRSAETDRTACPLGHGYWKNHADVWPVGSLRLGGQTYDTSELLEILRTPPRGDASVILAHQLIVAKLNLANGADPATGAWAFGEADSLLDGRGILPLGVRPSTETGQAMVAAAGALESFNRGEGVPGCNQGAHSDDVPASNEQRTPTRGSNPVDGSPRVPWYPALIAFGIAAVAATGIRERRYFGRPR